MAGEKTGTKIGNMSAYLDAVAQGYKGSREQFGRDLAMVADRAAEVAENLEESKRVLASATEEISAEAEKQTAAVNLAAEAKKQEINAVGAVLYNSDMELDEAQKTQARGNIGAASAAEVVQQSKDIEKTMDLICSGDTNGLIVFTAEKEGSLNEGHIISPSSGEMTTTSNTNYRVRYYSNLTEKRLRIKAYANYGNYYYSFLGSNWTSIGGKKETGGTSAITMFNEIVEVPTGAVALLVGEISPNFGGAYNSGIEISKKWNGKKWTCVGDSLTEKNSRTSKNYHDYIAENTGITVVNMGVSGTGYKKTYENNNAFYQRISSVPIDSDVVTIFGSGNDMGAGAELGTPTDTGTDTLCGCINTTIDNLISIMPTVQLGLVTPTPWIGYNPATDNAMKQYANAIVEICKARSIPCLDLYHCSNLRPWTEEGRSACYTKDGGNGVHPDDTGHKIIASRFEAFLASLII